MSANDTGAHPALAEGDRLDRTGAGARDPRARICLGSQLIARALGASVGPSPSGPEIGWAPVEIDEPDDPLLGPLAPSAVVLHWHGEAFETPPGAHRLASSARTECQAFRAGRAWGLLFHPEADSDLVRSWLGVPAMAAEAEPALGSGAATSLLAGAAEHERDLIARSTPVFAAFAGQGPTPT